MAGQGDMAGASPATTIYPRVAQRDEGKQADEKHLPVEERDSDELEQIRAVFPSER